MMLAYRVELTPDDNATFLVTCPDLPEVATWGETETDALLNALDAIETALAGRISDNAEIPLSGAGTDLETATVRIPSLTSLKVMLHLSLRHSGITRAELSRRLGWHREQVDRLFRIDHASRLDQLESAFKALGRELDIAVREAA
jgi:antitoxin HicB